MAELHEVLSFLTKNPSVAIYPLWWWNLLRTKVNPLVPARDANRYHPGVAVDEGTILAQGESVTVAAGDFTNTLRILDSSSLFAEFGHKSYAPGIGSVLELDFTPLESRWEEPNECP